jgi:hypothetical protein
MDTLIISLDFLLRTMLMRSHGTIAWRPPVILSLFCFILISESTFEFFRDNKA